ncbi:hypothetical protein [Streptomyces sp. NPDC057694]|uniref:hypothetical protein n=1 Tax=Streptomyces sp. NPDC057694 TaxID=3346216 RepID=UPI00369B93C4
MLETYLSWYREGRMDGSEFRSVANHLAQSGLTLEHPTLGCGILLDVVGEQVKLPVGRVLELVGLSLGPLCMQFWLSADTDVVCNVRYVAPDTQVLTFMLGGLTENERDQATDAVQRLIQREMNSSVALLVDLGGETAEGDDDALVLYGRLPMGPRPDRVQFRTDRLSAVPTVLAGAEVTDLGNGLSTVRWQ